jgi:hypothetical protein
MDLLGNDVDTLHEEIEHLVDHLVGNDVDTLHEEKNHLVGFSFIRVLGDSPRIAMEIPKEHMLVCT